MNDKNMVADELNSDEPGPVSNTAASALAEKESHDLDVGSRTFADPEWQSIYN